MLDQLVQDVAYTPQERRHLHRVPRLSFRVFSPFKSIKIHEIGRNEIAFKPVQFCHIKRTVAQFGELHRVCLNIQDNVQPFYAR